MLINSLKTGIQTPINRFATSALQEVTIKLKVILVGYFSFEFLTKISFLCFKIVYSFYIILESKHRTNRLLPDPDSPLIPRTQTEFSGKVA